MIYMPNHVYVPTKKEWRITFTFSCSCICLLLYLLCISLLVFSHQSSSTFLWSPTLSSWMDLTSMRMVQVIAFSYLSIHALSNKKKLICLFYFEWIRRRKLCWFLRPGLFIFWGEQKSKALIWFGHFMKFNI